MCLFEVTVALTEHGQPLWQDIAGLVLHYVQLIAQVGGWWAHGPDCAALMK